MLSAKLYNTGEEPKHQDEKLDRSKTLKDNINFQSTDNERVQIAGYYYPCSDKEEVY